MRQLVVVTAFAAGGCSATAESCTACELRVDRIAAFGDLDGDGALPGHVRSIIRDADGRLILGARNADRLLVFDTIGRFITGIGRRGEGPGEFGGSIYLLTRARGDSTVVVDAGSRQLKSFSRDWNPGWIAPDISAYGGGSLVALPAGGFVRSGEVRQRIDSIGHPLHLLDAEGRLVRSFGADSADPSSPITKYPTLAATPDGNVWAADRHRYRLILWSTDGSALRTIERHPEWFPPRVSGAAVTPEQPPVPAIEAIHLDRSNRLWIYVSVASPGWADGLGEERQGAHGPSYTVTDEELLRETVVEVLDAGSGELLASTRVPPTIRMAVDDGLAAAYVEDSLGVPRVELMRFTLGSL